MHSILMRMLIGLDDDPEFPHALLSYYATFTNPSDWFAGLQGALDAQISANAEALAKAGLLGEDPDRGKSLTTPWRFLRRAERLAGRLPDQVGALAILLDPEHVENLNWFTRSIEFLALQTRERWLKFIVLDNRSSPRLGALCRENQHVTVQTFWLSPEEIGKRLDVASGHSGEGEAGSSTLALAGAFTSSNRNYTRAEALQRQQILMAEREGLPIGIALSHYALGNTLLAAGQPEPAAQAFLRACEVCSTHALHELAPVAYTNLGVALHRLGDFGQAFAALKIGSRFFRAVGNLPGEAFVCDNLALMHRERGDAAAAARVWRYALSLYDGIRNPHFASVREAGRTEFSQKIQTVKGGGDGPR
jgi:tetratricopeptide (TPR) repeat protein